jgi:hypothetical protein
MPSKISPSPPLVPPHFPVPLRHETPDFLFMPLVVDLNELDYRAVVESRAHLHAMFGLAWPPANHSRVANRRAIGRHWRAFRRREAFTYAVLSLDERMCLGCVYIVRPSQPGHDARVFLWVRQQAHDQGLDRALYRAVTEWLAWRWPLGHVSFPGRHAAGDWYPLHGHLS